MTKRKDGLWQESVVINGKRKYFYGRTKAEVMRKMSEYKETSGRGRLFREVADDWDTEHETEVSWNAHRAYRVPYATCLEWFGDMPIRNVTAQDIDALIKKVSAQGFAKRTVKGYLSVISLIFQYGMRHGDCDQNPSTAVAVPSRLKVTHRTVPDEGDIERIKQSVDLPFGPFAYLLLYTGLRRGEALGLKYEDINFSDRTISITRSVYWEGNKPIIKDTKTAAGTRTIILLDALAEKLDQHGHGFVFGGDAPLTNQAFKSRWGKYVRESGVTATPHQLRHLFATILYECNIDEKVAQELMGHSSISTTRNIYTHIRLAKLNETRDILNAKL